jgi:dienelactone hydrolase
MRPSAGPSRAILYSLCLATITLGAAQTAASEDPVELVSIQTKTFPGSLLTRPFMPSPDQGESATITGILRLPGGAERTSAVVITHGCSGLTGAETFWSRHLRDFGIATLTVNSIGGRDIPRFCSGPHTMSAASLLTDVYRARDFLAAHPRVDASRIALMGFSLGGRTALWASHLRFEQRYSAGSARFAAHLAFYPTSCNIALVNEDQVQDVPIRIFQGAADDLIATDRCREYIARMSKSGKDAALFDYAGAKHSFDNPDLAGRPLMFDVVNSGKCSWVERDGQIVDAETGSPASMRDPCIIAKGTFGYSADAQRRAVLDVRMVLSELFRLR